MLPPAACLGTARLLRPSALHLSPAVGLAATSSTVHASNLYRASAPGMLHGSLGGGYGAAALFSRQLLHSPAEGELRLATSRSRAAAYLTPPLAGHILGLSLTHAPPPTVAAALRAAGVSTNHLRGERTGVSLARFARLVELLQLALRESAATPALPLLLRCVWERAERKECLLEYALALHSHLPVLAAEFTEIDEDRVLREAWLRSRFSPSDLSRDAVDAAAMRLLQQEPRDAAEYADSLELVAADVAQAPPHPPIYPFPLPKRPYPPRISQSISEQAHAFRQPVPLRRHAYRGGAAKPDCVEQSLRELLALLLWDADARRFDTARLPSSASADLVAFFGAAADSHEGSARWFDMCQQLPRCAYLSQAPDGAPYELAPTLANLSCAAAHLLGYADVASLSDLQARWNAGVSSPALRLRVDERSGAYRPQLSDVSRHRELVSLRLEQGDHSIELRMETHPPIAIITHHRASSRWRPDVRRAHLRAWSSGLSDRSPALAALWPAVLADDMLAALPHPPTRTGGAELLAFFSARWAVHADRWLPLADGSYAEGADAFAAMARRRQAHGRMLGAVRAALSSQPLAPLLPWVLRGLPEEIDPVALALAICTRRRPAAGEEGSLAALNLRLLQNLVGAAVPEKRALVCELLEATCAHVLVLRLCIHHASSVVRWRPLDA
ncbi:hypothetical protein AB1Y20_013263 [Prymnesium parvum]|uniref:Uncharacterized protein n=1 Tax=Prymnesium parvum TaxID=97485 RepID=A0AB34IN84_PRYPA